MLLKMVLMEYLLVNSLEIREVNQNPDRITFSKVYIPYYSGLANKLNDFDKKIKELNESE